MKRPALVVVNGWRRAVTRVLSALGATLLVSSACLSQVNLEPQPLTLEDAIAQALAHNSSLAQAQMETRRAQADLVANRTKRYTSTSITGQGSQLITQPQLTFAAGSLGTFPTTGPIPATNQTITIPRAFTGILSATATQPLSTLIKLHFSLKTLELGVAGTRQDEQKQRLATIDMAREDYYAVVEAQAEYDSASASLPYYRESLREAAEEGKVETILPAQLLRAKAQLLQAENSLSQADDKARSAQEKLNDAMGRDIHTPFRVVTVADAQEEPESEAALEMRALLNRPDVRKSQSDVQKAGYDLRAKKAEYIPEISGSVSYYTTFNFGNTLPSNIGLAGLALNWEPFDWGRKRQEIIEKRIVQDEAKVSAASTQRSALMEVSNARRQLQNARRQLALSEANQLTARETLRELQEQARVEEKLPKDLLQAQSDLASADSQQRQALTNFWDARSALKKATGDE